MEGRELEVRPPELSHSACLSPDVQSSAPYLRGFHDAERRRKVVNEQDELPFTTFVLQYTASMAPLAVLWVGALWFFTRGKKRPMIGRSEMHVNPSSEKAQFTAAGGAKQPGNFSHQGEEKGTFKEEMKKIFQNAMAPLSPRSFRVNVKGTRFKDVIGMPEAVAQVQQYVHFLQCPEKFTRLGARLPKGCLLSGPPGTGKTLLAKAVAGEADVPFFSCNGADFVELYAGSGPKRVRELFSAAKEVCPSVIFIDELDAVGSRSGQAVGSSISAEENRTINQLLAELDGLSTNGALVVFAATNFRDNIDKALLREGRFDRKVELTLPDQSGREALFAHYLNQIKLEEEHDRLISSPLSAATVTSLSSSNSVTARPDLVMAAKLASLTPGVSPATIATIVNESAIQAAAAGYNAVPPSCIFPAVDDVLWGKRQLSRSSRILSSALLRTAWHESGHALVACLLSPLQSKVLKVSIIPRHLHASRAESNQSEGGMLTGYTQQMGKEALDMKTELSLFSDVCVMLGGRYGERMLIEKQTRPQEGETLSNNELPEGNPHHSDGKSSKIGYFSNDPTQSVSTGAQDDFQRATKIAIENFLAFGMAPSVPPVVSNASTGSADVRGLPTYLGLLSYEPQRLREGRIFQKHTAAAQALAEEEAARFIHAAGQFVEALLLRHAQTLSNLAASLLEKKELDEEDLEKILWSVTGDSKNSLTDRTGALGDVEFSHAASAEEKKSLSVATDESSAPGEKQWCEIKEQARRALSVFLQASEEAALKRALGRSSLLQPSA